MVLQEQQTGIDYQGPEGGDAGIRDEGESVGGVEGKGSLDLKRRLKQVHRNAKPVSHRFLLSILSYSLTNTSFRTKNNNTTNSSSLPSKIPISITEHPSELCLTCLAALLCHWEVRVVNPEYKENKVQQTVEKLKIDVHALKENVGGET
jgi:hypothetical protein